MAARLPRTPSPADLATSWSREVLKPAVDLLAGRDGRLSTVELERAAAKLSGPSRLVLDNLKDAFAATGSSNPSVDAVVKAGEQLVLQSAQRAAGRDQLLATGDDVRALAASLRPDFDYLRGLTAVDGRKFCAQALTDVRSRVARGERAVVVFDLDNTVADTRARTLAIAHAYDAAQGTHLFDHLSLEQVQYDGRGTAAAAGLTDRQAESFGDFWHAEFWKPQYLVHDLPMQPIIDLAQQAKAAGAEVLYLTGRAQFSEEGTIAQLRRLDLPDADAAHVISKPAPGMSTPDFKVRELEKLENRGVHTAWFFTEGRQDLGFIQKHLDVPCVLLDSTMGGHSPVKDGTPLWPLVF